MYKSSDKMDKSRTRASCDDLCYPRYYSSMKLDFHRSQFNFQPNAYASTAVCHYPESTAPSTVRSVNNSSSYGSSTGSTVKSLYRSTPLLNYGANSYFGWHNTNRSYATSTLPVHPDRKPPVHSAETSPYKFNTIDNKCGTPFCIDASIVKPQSSSESVVGSSSLFDTNFALNRSKRMKYFITVAIVIIIVAVLVAMAVAVYSQVYNNSSASSNVGTKGAHRNYRGFFLVSADPSSKFDQDLLNKESSSFKNLGAFFAKKIDAIFRASDLGSVYIGSEIAYFRFPSANAYLEVHFVLNTKANEPVLSKDLLEVLEDGIKANGGSFSDFVVEMRSLTIEDELIKPKLVAKPTEKI